MFVVRDPNFLSTVHDVLQVLKLCEQLLVYYRLLQYHRPTASDFIFCRVAVGSRGKPNDVIATKWLLIKESGTLQRFVSHRVHISGALKTLFEPPMPGETISKLVSGKRTLLYRIQKHKVFLRFGKGPISDQQERKF